MLPKTTYTHNWQKSNSGTKNTLLIIFNFGNQEVSKATSYWSHSNAMASGRAQLATHLT